MNVLRLIGVFVRIGAMSELAYRANFWIQALESLINVSAVLGLIGVVVSQTDHLAGWTPPELLVIVGVYFMMLGLINLVISPSLSRFMEEVREGTLDYTLVKPQDAQLLVSLCQVQIWKVLDLLAGAGVLAYAVTELPRRVGGWDVLGFGIAMFAATAIVYSFWLVLGTLAFWFIRIENILMIFWMVYAAGRWPIGIYPGWLRWTLTLVVPIAFAVTVPAQAVAGRLDVATLALAVALALCGLVGSRAFWRFGLRHYAGASA
jgi:ABC-2 type transport system permease protein